MTRPQTTSSCRRYFAGASGLVAVLQQARTDPLDLSLELVEERRSTNEHRVRRERARAGAQPMVALRSLARSISSGFGWSADLASEPSGLLLKRLELIEPDARVVVEPAVGEQHEQLPPLPARRKQGGQEDGGIQTRSGARAQASGSPSAAAESREPRADVGELYSLHPLSRVVHLVEGGEDVVVGGNAGLERGRIECPQLRSKVVGAAERLRAAPATGTPVLLALAPPDGSRNVRDRVVGDPHFTIVRGETRRSSAASFVVTRRGIGRGGVLSMSSLPWVPW